MSGFRFRYLWPVVLIALCFLSLCTITAVSLFHQQAAVTGLLRENVESRRAAGDLRGCLNTLIELEIHHVEAVADQHARARGHLAHISRLADQPAERDLADRLTAGFDEYLRAWDHLPPVTDPGHRAAVDAAIRLLEQKVLLPCGEIEGYNDERVDESTRHHEQVLRNLAWGLAVIGGLGAVAGVILGYGVAHGLARSILRLRVQIRDAAGKLGPDLPEIVLTEQGAFSGLHAEVDRLSERIEEVVDRLQRREREVLRAEQMAAVGQLAAGVAHEIRNPLTAIKMLVQTGMEDGRLPADDLRVIEAEVRRMERALQTFLDFARPAKAERRPTDLAPVVQGVVGLVRGRAEKQRVAVRVELPPGGVTVTADEEQLRQVFVNLCLNALDAMPTGGTLILTVRTANPRQAQVEVSDTGPGIPKAVLPRLFEPFVSSKDTGLGLGLVISERIVRDHAGTIGAANRVGGGASFFVTLPAGDPHAQTTGR
jgi:two-component system, NtrC family, sensor histidine kinase HydH